MSFLKGRVTRRAVCSAGAALFALAATSGCHDYRWQADHQRAEARAREQDRHLFIFYKHWLSSESNRMHGEVLTDPQVGALFQDTVNVLLEKDSSPEFSRYMSRFGVLSAPAFVILAPDGSHQVRTGYIPQERFIEFVEAAKAARPQRPAEPRARPL
jgi:hypothetical protein